MRHWLAAAVLSLVCVASAGCPDNTGVLYDAQVPDQPGSVADLDLGRHDARPDTPQRLDQRSGDADLNDGPADLPLEAAVDGSPKMDGNKPAPDLFKPKPDLPQPKPDLYKPKPDLFKPKPDLYKPKPDLFKPKPDLYKPKPDLYKPDQFKPKPDLYRPDQFKPKPDLYKPDQFKPKPDLYKPDLFKPKPDLYKPDLFKPKPDLPRPDLLQPDQYKPDLYQPKPDLPRPDLYQPDQFKPKPDLLQPDTSGGAVSYTGSFPSGTGYKTAYLGVGGFSNRKVVLYTPQGLANKPALLITLHGTHGDAKQFIQQSYAKGLADSKKVLIASPQARKMTKGDWDSHYPNDIYWETYPAVNPNTNPDLLLIRAIILEAQKARNVDPRRVYVLGHSNGGFFSILVAMTLPDKIAAFVANSSGLVRCATMPDCSFSTSSGNTCAKLSARSGYKNCAAKCTGAEKPGPVATTGRKPPGYLAHSNDDSTISVYYTCTLAARMAALGYSSKVTIYSGNGHSIPYNLAVDAWPWVSQYQSP